MHTTFFPNSLENITKENEALSEPELVEREAEGDREDIEFGLD